MRHPAPPYVGEGPHELWHVSEDGTIESFAPHVSATASSPEPRVWAVDTRHLPLYWFPRECPRGTFWANSETSPDDLALLAGAARVRALDGDWLDRMRAARVFAYRLPGDSFDPDPEVGGYWLSREEVAPLGVVELGDLVGLHTRAGIELRLVASLWPLWDRIVDSTLEFSGIRLHNTVRPAKP